MPLYGGLVEEAVAVTVGNADWRSTPFVLVSGEALVFSWPSTVLPLTVLALSVAVVLRLSPDDPPRSSSARPMPTSASSRAAMAMTPEVRARFDDGVA